MATCKDCIHFEVCKDYLIECAVHGESERMNVPCAKFKNKADFVEVKHGHWVAKASTHISKRGRLINYNRYKCSECGKWNGRHKPKHCPDCGAKMDGKNDNDLEE